MADRAAAKLSVGIGGDTPIDRLRHCLMDPPHNAWLGAQPFDASESDKTIAVTMDIRPEMSLSHTHTIAHGGIVASLIDITGHAAVAVWHGAVTPTIGLNIEYLSPAIGDRLVARGFLRKLGRSIARADVEIWAGDRLVALGRGSFSTKETRT